MSVSIERTPISPLFAMVARLANEKLFLFFLALKSFLEFAYRMRILPTSTGGWKQTMSFSSPGFFSGWPGTTLTIRRFRCDRETTTNDSLLYRYSAKVPTAHLASTVHSVRQSTDLTSQDNGYFASRTTRDVRYPSFFGARVEITNRANLAWRNTLRYLRGLSVLLRLDFLALRPRIHSPADSATASPAQGQRTLEFLGYDLENARGKLPLCGIFRYCYVNSEYGCMDSSTFHRPLS
jgi:hypothetical protein